MRADPPRDPPLVTPEPLARLKQPSHSWFGVPELVGYATFLAMAALIAVGVAPEIMARISAAPWLRVLEDVQPLNARQFPNGIVGVDVYRWKIRTADPIAVPFYIINDLTASGDKGIRVLPFRSLDPECKVVDPDGNRPLKYKTGPITSHFCFELPLQARAPGVDYSVRGEFMHSAWPFFRLAPIIKPISKFKPARVEP